MGHPRISTIYRPDIDGLRALAVLSVILFHINESILPGGFVGVDVFFVISGYLITRNIVSELDAGRFSLIDFYRRRVKRIAPAMLLVVGSTVVLAQLLTIPEDAERTAESAIWSIASLANVYFWLFQDQSYFAQDSAELPLLHLWSLGVEEQFYLVWPVLLLVLSRSIKPKPIMIALCCAALLSYVIGDALFNWSPSFVYYMLPTRAGELLIGAILAYSFARGYQIHFSRRQAESVGFVGLALLGGSFFLLSEEQAFPGMRAIPPTLGAGLLILAGRVEANRVSRFLSVAPLVWVGLVSYSAYLWHWPLLAFLRYGIGEITPIIAGLVFILTFLLSTASYYLVEQPCRLSKWGASRIFTVQFLMPAAAIGGFCLVVMITDGIRTRPDAQAFQDLRPAYAYDYVCQRWLVTEAILREPRCIIGGNGPSAPEPELILWGDSNAAHYIGTIGAFAQSAGFRFRNVQHASCPPLLTDPSPYVAAREREDCLSSLQAVRPALEAAEVLLISAAWTTYQKRDDEFLSVFFGGIEVFVKQGKKVILIGKAPTFSGYDRRCLQKAKIYPFLKCIYPTIPSNQGLPEINERLQEFAEAMENVEYFDITPVICPDSSCSPMAADGRALYYDSEHLSMQGSWQIGKEYLDKFGLPAAFSNVEELHPALSTSAAGTAKQQ